MGINQRVSLRKFTDDIRRWVDEGRSDDGIASALGTSLSSVQSFRSRNAIYRRGTTSTLHDPQDFSSDEGVLEPAGPGVGSTPRSGTTRAGRNAGRHREGRAAAHTDQDRTPQARCRQGPGDPLASISARSGCAPLVGTALRGLSALLAERLRSCCTRSLGPRACSRRANNASVDIISIGPGPCVPPRTPSTKRPKSVEKSSER